LYSLIIEPVDQNKLIIEKNPKPRIIKPDSQFTHFIESTLNFKRKEPTINVSRIHQIADPRKTPKISKNAEW
jgi:hypothetical protein